jgi:GNAT superfamily N-acetyltransferase
MTTTATGLDHTRYEYGLIDRPDHPDFDAVYQCYQKCFPLPTEQESKENFLAILEDNKDAAKPGREMWVYIKDKRTGEVLGADNFDAFPAAGGHEINGTCQDIYMFVDEKYRRQGLYSRLVALREQATAQYLQEIGRVPDAQICTFAEQINPLMMSPAQYVEDSEAAIDQCVRRSIFERPIKTSEESDHREPGFRTIQMRYVQPPLEADGEVCDYLDYVVKMPDHRTTIPAEIVRGHLDQFFEKSFPEGTSLGTEGLAGMKRDLEVIREIPLESTGKFDDLGTQLSIGRLSQLPEAQHERRIGELFPELVQQHYGKGVSLDDAMTDFASIREKTGHTKGMSTPSAGGFRAAVDSQAGANSAQRQL